MTSPLKLLEHQLVVFRSYSHWIDIKRFATESAGPERELLTALIEHAQYHDHYTGQDAEEQDHHSLHGPYKLEAITASIFHPGHSSAGTREPPRLAE